MGVSKVDYNNETLIDISNDTLSEDTLFEGFTGHDSNGEPITGKFPISEVDTQADLISQIKTALDGKAIGNGGTVKDDRLDKLLDGSLVDLNSGCSKVSPYAMYQRMALETVNVPNASDIGMYACQNCTSLHTANMPAATNIGNYGFMGCTQLKSPIYLPLIKTIGNNAFMTCTPLDWVDIGSEIVQIGTNAFNSCALSVLIIRKTSGVPTLGSNTAFTNSGIAKGTGYIYVPAALIETYQSATNWSKFASQFRALEDYTVDGTVTGALDESKI